MRGALVIAICISMVLAGAVGCQNTAPQATPPLPQSTSASTPTSSPTQVEEAVAAPSQVANPLRFTLPTPGVIPVSAWRPPLYPVPWALGEHDHFYFARPVAADEVNWPLPVYRYGNTEFGGDRPHTGVDIVTPLGTPVLAAASGRVIWSGIGLYNGYEDPEDPYGIAIAIRHDFGYGGERLYSAYAHLSETLVERGDYVELGDTIGLSGDTGWVTAPHLHFEVRLGSNDYFHSVNPELWFSPPQGWGVLVGKIMSSGGALLLDQEMRITSQESNRRWYVKSYGTLDVINRDPYYRENFVLSGLPAGIYDIFIPYNGYEMFYTIEIIPGGVTFFNFWGLNGFDSELPQGSVPESVPYELE